MLNGGRREIRRVKVAIFVRNVNSSPGSYYRIIQYLNNLEDHGSIEVFGFSPEYYYKRGSRRILQIYRAIVYLSGCMKRFSVLLRLAFSKERYTLFVQRELVPRKVPGFLAKLIEKSMRNAEKVIWDFDDNIKESGEISGREFDLLCKYSTSILVCNEFLKSTLPESVQTKVTLIPTTDRAAENIDLDEINGKRLETFDNKIILVWVGTAGNLTYLQKILPDLDRAAVLIKESGKQLQLRIVSNSSLKYEGVALNIENVKWSRSVANDELKNAHIGLMPLEENYYTPGKCGFKAVQYIGMGLPAIVSDVGFNTEVVRDEYNGFVVSCKGQWTERIVQLAFDSQLWKTISNNARAVWKENFNTKDVIERLKEIIKS